MNFEIDETIPFNVVIHEEWNSYLKKDQLTNLDLVEVLKGKGQCSVTSDDDHPEFKKLRNELEEKGFIETERKWWNGDRVLKTFKLNGVRFKRDEKFPCGAAMKFHLESRRKYK